MPQRKTLTEQSVRLGKRLEAIPGEILQHLRPALMRSAEEVAANMRALVPVDSGALQESITVTAPGQETPAYAEGGGKRTAGPNQALVTAGNEHVRHGHLVEWGTVELEAQPFMMPAWRTAKPRIERRIQRAIAKAIREAGSKT